MKTHINYLLTCSLLTLSSSLAIQAHAADINHNISAGIGYNSNVYRTPGGNYTDWGQGATPFIRPDVQSGFFTDLDYTLKGLHALNRKTALSGEFDLSGKFHLGSDLTNADETKYKIDLGANRILSGKKRRISTIEGLVFINNVDKTYYDRDTGLKKTTGAANTDIADRYSYSGNGFQFNYKNKIDRGFQYGAGLTLGSRDYTDTIANSQMDYDYTIIEADVKYKLQPATTLSAGIDREVQDYNERPSRNLAGTLSRAHPALEYTYLTLAFGIRHKLNDSWTLRGSYKIVDREDGWLDYNGYSANKVQLRAIRKVANTRTKFSLSTQSRDYPNALAFDKPVNGSNVNKTYDTLAWSVAHEIEQTKNRSLWGKVAYNETDTNDLRYNYDRFIVTAGYKWQY